jgi:purine-binding chemotaxis protein CheW
MSYITTPDADCFSDQVASSAAQQEFVLFKIGAKEYGIGPAKIKGMRGYEHVIPLRDAPGFLVGVIHYNGLIAPVIDLRVEFDPGLPAHGISTNVLMLNHADHIIGMVVRSVSDVISLHDNQIGLVADAMHPSQAAYLTGIANLDERKIYLINSARMMSRINMWFQLEKEIL